HRTRDDLISKVLSEVIGGLEETATQIKAEAALSRIHAAARLYDYPPTFRSCFRTVRGFRRVKIKAKAVALDWPGLLASILYIVAPAGCFAAVSAAIFKTLPGFYGWALAQDQANAGRGAFQGFTAGWIWAGLVVLGLTTLYFYTARADEYTDVKPV